MGVLMSACASTCLSANPPLSSAYPNDSCVGVLALRSRDCSHRLDVSFSNSSAAYERVVAAEREGQLALAHDARNVVREPFVDSRHGDRLAQLADRLVFLVCLGRELGDLSLQLLVVLNRPAELLELRRQAGLDQRSRTFVNTGARLASGEGIREDLSSAESLGDRS